jgi:formylglycine-generating enzyme required for sulfatase activity
LAATDAADLQQQSGLAPLEIDLGEDVSMRFVPVPAGQFVMGSARGEDNEFPQVAVSIERPFLLGQFEVTNAQFARFDPEHNSGVIDERWKDRSRRGTAIDQPDAPVVRITWHQAQAFCEWLSRRSGRRCTLPSEGQWEWACRAGTATDFYVGDRQAELSPFANLADESLRGWNHGRAETGYNDGLAYSVSGGRFAPNAWGLYDMHGNVAEWCASSYRPYPYSATDGRETPAVDEAKVVRGGSWNETFRDATSAARWRYPPHQPVHNIRQDRRRSHQPLRR